MISCANCKKDIEKFIEPKDNIWDLVATEIECPFCKTIVMILYDESTDDEGGEFGWFYTEIPESDDASK